MPIFSRLLFFIQQKQLFTKLPICPCKPAPLTLVLSLSRNPSFLTLEPYYLRKLRLRPFFRFFSLVIDETMDKLPSTLTSTGIRCLRKDVLAFHVRYY